MSRQADRSIGNDHGNKLKDAQLLHCCYISICTCETKMCCSELSYFIFSSSSEDGCNCALLKATRLHHVL